MIEAFCVDLDGTLVDPVRPFTEDELLAGNPIFTIFLHLMIASGWQTQEARKAIVEYAEDIVWWDYPDFIAEFNLPMQESWRQIFAWHEGYLMVHADVVAVVKKLKNSGYPLFVVSNNPYSGCLLKLKRAGLAELSGSTWFSRILGSNLLRGQKGDIAFWRRGIAQLGLEPESLAMIGDNLHEDAVVPLSCNIGHALIIDRSGRPASQAPDRTTIVSDPGEILQVVSRGQRAVDCNQRFCSRPSS